MPKRVEETSSKPKTFSKVLKNVSKKPIPIKKTRTENLVLQVGKTMRFENKQAEAIKAKWGDRVKEV